MEMFDFFLVISASISSSLIIEIIRFCLTFTALCFSVNKESTLMLSNIVTMVGGLSENFLNCMAGFFCQIVFNRVNEHSTS